VPANDHIPWTAASEEPDHAVSALDGATVGQGVTLRVELAPTARGGARLFRAFLDSADLGVTLAPIVTGAHRTGDAPAMNWVEITDFAGSVPVAGGDVEIPEGIDIQVLHALATLVPAGGHLIAEYASDHRRTTDRALRQGVPPVATPLGGMMFAAGCGVAFRDWRVAASSEGARRLQGYRAVDSGHEARRAPETLAALERFMDSSAELDWDLQLKCRPLAEAAITVLRARLGVLASTFAAT
jgi:hypothetical protein